MKRPLYNYARERKPKKNTLALFIRTNDTTVELITFEYYKIRTKRISSTSGDNYGRYETIFSYYVYFDDKEFKINESDFDVINKIILNKNKGE